MSNINNLDSFPEELKGQAGGILIVDMIDNEPVIILGKSNNPKREGTWESFGGRYETKDISSLHTAIREMIEEFFNLKLETEQINDIVLQFKNQNFIKKRHELYGMSYLIDFQGLNFIFQKLSEYKSEFKKFGFDNNFFNLSEYINQRVILHKPSHGLNEIEKIQVFNLSDIKNNKVNLRWFTNKIIHKMVFDS